MKKMLMMPNRLLQIISLVLLFNLGFSQKIKTDSILKNYIIYYKPVYKCNDVKVSIPRFPNIDSVLYLNIEKSFSNEDYSCLYLLLTAVYINHNVYISKFNQEYIINDGLTCQDNSIIRLIRIAMKSNLFILSLVSEDIETTGDILYWANNNKDRIVNFSNIGIIGDQKTIYKRKKIINKLRSSFHDPR